MSAQPINMTLYRLLVRVGAEEREAEEAARLDASELVTKADLKELEIRLLRAIAQALLGATAIFSIVVTVVMTLFQFYTP